MGEANTVLWRCRTCSTTCTVRMGLPAGWSVSIKRIPVLRVLRNGTEKKEEQIDDVAVRCAECTKGMADGVEGVVP
jgi:hypothetical protein